MSETELSLGAEHTIEALQRRVGELEEANANITLIAETNRDQRGSLYAENERLRAALGKAQDEASLGVQRTRSKSALINRFYRIFHVCEATLSPQPNGQDND